MKQLLTLLLALHCLQTAKAQENTFSLKQAVEFTLTNQPQVKNALLEEELSRKKVDEIIGLGTPQIEANAELNNFLDIPVSFVPGEFFGGEPGTYFPVQFGQQYTASAGISVSQLLFDGSYLVGLQASRTYQELSRKQSRQTRTDAAVNVTKAYFGALVSDARLEIIEANIIRVNKLLSDTRALNEAGFVEKIDVDRLELTANNLKVEKDKILRFKAISYALLKYQMNFPLDKEITLTDKLSESVLEGAQLPDSVNFNTRPEMDVLNVSRKLQELDIKRYKSTYFPSLAAFGAFSYNNARSEFDFLDGGLKWFPTTIIGAKLTIPIWDGLQKSARIAQARIKLQQVDNSIEYAKNGFRLELNTAKANFQNNYSSLAIVKKNRTLAEDIARSAEIKYDNGVGSSLELVDAESSLREAEANYYSTLYETIIARIDLDKASGVLNY